jgi:hypothetical protein
VTRLLSPLTGKMVQVRTAQRHRLLLRTVSLIVHENHSAGYASTVQEIERGLYRLLPRLTVRRTLNALVFTGKLDAFSQSKSIDRRDVDVLVRVGRKFDRLEFLPVGEQI